MEISTIVDKGTCTVTLKGRFTFMDHASFREILEHMHEDAVGEVICDVSGVDFIDSAGLGMLLLARDDAEKLRKPLSIRGAGGQVKKIFEVAHFDTMFNLV